MYPPRPTNQLQNGPQPQTPTSTNHAKEVIGELCDRIKNEYTSMYAHIQSLKSELDKATSQRADIERQYNHNFDMSYFFSNEVHKMMDVIKRLVQACMQQMPFLPPDLQSSCLHLIEQVKHYTNSEMLPSFIPPPPPPGAFPPGHHAQHPPLGPPPSHNTHMNSSMGIPNGPPPVPPHLHGPSHMIPHHAMIPYMGRLPPIHHYPPDHRDPYPPYGEAYRPSQREREPSHSNLNQESCNGSYIRDRNSITGSVQKSQSNQPSVQNSSETKENGCDNLVNNTTSNAGAESPKDIVESDNNSERREEGAKSESERNEEQSVHENTTISEAAFPQKDEVTVISPEQNESGVHKSPEIEPVNTHCESLSPQGLTNSSMMLERPIRHYTQPYPGPVPSHGHSKFPPPYIPNRHMVPPHPPYPPGYPNMPPSDSPHPHGFGMNPPPPHGFPRMPPMPHLGHQPPYDPGMHPRHPMPIPHYQAQFPISGPPSSGYPAYHPDYMDSHSYNNIFPGVPKTFNHLSTLIQGDVVCSVSFSMPTGFLYSGSKGNVKIWDVSDIHLPRQVSSIECLKDNYVRAVKSINHNKLLIVSGEYSSIGLWSLGYGAKGCISATSVREFTNPAPVCYDMVVSSDEKNCFCCLSNGTVVGWDIEKGQPFRTFNGHNDGATCIDMYKDGSLLYSGSLDGTVRAWDPRDNKSVKVYSFPSPAFSISCSPSYDFFVVGLENNTIELIQTKDTTQQFGERQVFKVHESWVLTLHLSHSGKWLISSSRDNYVNCVKIPQGVPMFITRENSSILCTDISPDDKYIVTGGGERRANVYESVYP